MCNRNHSCNRNRNHSCNRNFMCNRNRNHSCNCNHNRLHNCNCNRNYPPSITPTPNTAMAATTTNRHRSC